MNDDRMTHKEHIVPKVYLKGFSPDKKSVYSYEIKMSQPTNRLVPVSSICFTKDYYELIDENGNYMLPNHMENLMSDIETSFMMHRALLERKVFISANQYCSSILSKEEKEFWILYVAIQMMRTKLGVDLYTSYLSDYSENFSEIMIRNLALVSCTPSFATFLASDKTPLPVLFRKLNEGFVSFGVTNKNVLWTSDLPVFTFKSNTDVDPDYSNIMFPVTSRILLFLFAGRDKRTFFRNRVIPLPDNLIRTERWCIAQGARERIISYELFSEEDVKMIHDAREKKSLSDKELTELMHVSNTIRQ